MTKQINRLLIMMLSGLFLIGASGCSGQNSNMPITVTTAQAVNREITATQTLSGVLVPVQTVDIAGKISGQVISLGFQVGSRVKAGDVLLRLDTESIKVQLLQAQASLQAARAGNGSADNQTRHCQNQSGRRPKKL